MKSKPICALIAGFIAIAGCQRERETPKFYTEFCSKFTNAIPSQDLLRWADSIFAEKTNQLGLLLAQNWPSFLTNKNDLQPNFIALSRLNKTNRSLILEYAGSFGSMGVSIREKETAISPDYDPDRFIIWTDRVTIYYSP